MKTLGILVALLLIVGVPAYVAYRIWGKNTASESQTITLVPKKTSFAWIGWLTVIAIVILACWWIFAPGKPPASATAEKPAAIAIQQNWQLSWEKKPEHQGKTGIRHVSLPAKIETRDYNHIIISYSFSGGKGVMEGTSIDGASYDGQWKDSTGWGKWHLRFTSSGTAFGWSDDEGSGEKIPNILQQK